MSEPRPLQQRAVFMDDSRSKLSILLLIRSLGVGGAERQLTNLARGLVSAGHEVCVAVYYPVGPYLAELRQGGVPVVSLNKRGRWDLIPFMWRLQTLVRNMKPGVLYGSMPTENLACLLISRLVRPRAKVVWGIRTADFEATGYGLMPWAVRALERWLVHAPDLVISNSHRGLAWLGLRADNGHGIVIPNGIDTARFRPADELARAGRALLEVGEGTRLVGLVGRLDPIKGHDCFLRAAAIVAREVEEVRFAIVGSGCPTYRASMVQLAHTLGLSDRVIWREAIGNVEIVYNAIEVLVMSSVSEGFPNVVAEAMACGAAVVATDVGDTARLVGTHGRVVPRNDPAALAAAILETLRNNNERAASARRTWIVDRFGIQALIRATEVALAVPGQTSRGGAA
jgi:glycosyltransferase involved in cell wall biosynthesis